MEVFYFVVFVVFSFFLIFPTKEIESVGLTIDQLCAHFITDVFIMYHIKLACIKLIIHLTMPLCYIGIMWLLAWINPDMYGTLGEETESSVWNMFVACSWTLAGLAVAVVIYWSLNSWSNHPIVKQLESFTGSTFQNWRSVAYNIDDEYRRDTKMLIRSNAISTLVVTESWIIKTTMYGMNVAKQNATSMVAYKIDIQDVPADTYDPLQFVSIAVKPLQLAEQFTIRVNGAHFKDLQDHIRRPIVLLPSVKFFSLLDWFVEVFTEQVELNPTFRYAAPPDMDNCLACIQVLPDVKLVKHCLDVDENGTLLPEDQRCQQCQCRPMWCIKCMAQWFASRQDRSQRYSWMRKKATCPMCRARFCVLDVCKLVE